MKNEKILYFVLYPFTNFFVSADVISVNSGGDNGMIINPDTYIEGFFSCVPKTCSYFGYNCDSWDDGCGNAINCGSCSSGFTCTSGICTAVPPVPPPGVPGGEQALQKELFLRLFQKNLT